MMPERVDNLGSRFVKMEGLEKDIFELETPFSRFLTKALEAGVHLNKPKSFRLNQTKWDRRVNIVIIRTFAKTAGMDEILQKKFSQKEIGREIFPGEKGPLVRERIRQLFEEGAYYLYHASPGYLKQQYPDLLNQMETVHDFMVSQKSTTKLVAGAVLTGATTYQDLIRRGFSSNDLSASRAILDQYHLHVPYTEAKEATKRLIKDLQALTGQEDKEQIKQVLDRISRSFYQKHRREFETYCLTLTDLCTLVELKKPRRLSASKGILQALDNLGIPHRHTDVWFILAAQKDKAVKGLI